MKFLITAGPTREFIDPFRFISNPSSGLMGYALAAAAVRSGGDVVLISGPTYLEPVKGARTVPVISAENMFQAVEAEFSGCDVLIMAAAVSDWRPRVVSRNKIKKTEAPLSLDLVATKDILATMGTRKGHRIVVGFAAETDNIIDYAKRKLENKKLDIIVANNIAGEGSGFGVLTNEVVIIRPGEEPDTWPLLTKQEIAEKLVDLVINLYEKKN